MKQIESPRRVWLKWVLAWAMCSCSLAWAQGTVSPGTDTALKPLAVQPVLTEPGRTADARAEGSTPLAMDPDYKLTPNDLIEVEVFGVSELKRTVRINSTGFITLPLIGVVQVAGLSPADAEALIAIQYGAKYLQDPQVSVFVKEFTTRRITIDGAVAKPGVYPLTGPVTLLRAIAMAGGSGFLPDMENVMLFRMTPEGKTTSEKHNVLKIRAGEEPDPMLQSDDVVVVNRDQQRATFRDSLFRDVLDTLNPFSSTYRNAVAN